MNSKKHETNMSNDARIAVLETTILNINSNLLEIKQEMKFSSEKMDRRFDAFEKKMDSKFDRLEKKMDSKFDGVDSKFDAIQNRLWSNFLWLMSMIIGLAGLIAHTQHWI